MIGVELLLVVLEDARNLADAPPVRASRTAKDIGN
jgi:hypothetical protein